jgi:hypothetical protein
MIRIFALFVSLLCTTALAGDWQPDQNVKYTFIATPEAHTSSTVAEDQWIEDLIANLKKGGANPKVVYRFSKSMATFAINGSLQPDTVCVSRDDPDVYLVVKSNYARFIVNFKTKEIGANNYGGSVFVPPSKSFCVLVLDRKDWPPGGIPITSAPSNQATFEGRSVSWH